MGCEKEELGEKLQFKELRAETSQNFFNVIDDVNAQKTTVIFHNEIIIQSGWIHGIYGGPIVTTRLLWAQSLNGIHFLMVGSSDLSYEKLLIIKSGEIRIIDIGIIKLIDAELVNDNMLIFKYNNSWTRTGPRPDERLEIKI